jgi:hypothetical protein
MLSPPGLKKARSPKTAKKKAMPPSHRFQLLKKRGIRHRHTIHIRSKIAIASRKRPSPKVQIRLSRAVSTSEINGEIKGVTR